jgi:Tannase and feruloyl esterase
MNKTNRSFARWQMPGRVLLRAVPAALLAVPFFIATPASARPASPPPTALCDAASMQLLVGDDATVVSAAVLATPVAAASYCRVDGYVTTTGPGPNSNQVRFTVSMPLDFTNRYYFQGEGGSAGYLPEPPEKLLTAGFAYAGTDAGSPTPGINWLFAQDRTKAYDYAQRGGHVSAVVTQKIVKAYYGLEGRRHHAHGRDDGRDDDRRGEPAKRLYRYHDGCSGGGRMGMVAASWYPDDFDGVIAAAPGLNVNNQLIFGKVAKHLIDNPAAWVSPAQLLQLEQALVQRFDASDGALDGLISDPSKVVIDEALLAPFTAAQRSTLRIVIDGMNDFGQTYAGFSVGNPIGWSAFMLGTSAPPWALLPGRLPPAGYFVFDSTSRGLYGATYDFSTQLSFDSSADVNGWNAKYEEVFIGSGTARPENLRRFFAKGGKMLFWHGTADNGISMFDMLRFYDELAAQHRGVQATQRFSRLFLVPGVQHCGGGIGPQDVSDQALKAITRWVEEGEAPRSMVGHSAPNPALLPRSFLLCPHPEKARFLGGLENRRGLDVNDAANWRCERPRSR